MASTGTHISDPGATDGSARVLTTTPAANDPGLVVRIAGSSGGGGAVTIADGADVAEGSTTDAAVQDANGTVNAHVRGIIKTLLAGIGRTWTLASGTDSVSAVLGAETTKVIGTVNQGTSPWATNDPGLPNALGQSNAAGSTSVVLASDQALPLPAGAATSALQTTMSGNQTNGTQQSKITDGTDIADVITGDSGNNGLVVAASRKEVTGTTSTVAAICSTDVSNYSYVCVQFTATGGSATNAFQSSNDNTNWVNSPLVRATQLNNAATASGTTGDLYFGILPGRYFRINVTGIVSGSTTAVVEFSTLPRALHTMGVNSSQSGTWTVQVGNTPNTTPILATIAAGTTGGYSYSHIAAGQATTTVKSGAGTLHAVVFSGAATALNVTTIYDNTAGSGTVIGIPSATAVVAPTTVIYDLAFATGLTIVTATANGSDMTVMYK